jgi:glycosyltransferase involved in cell wall biosynthesis
VNILLIHQAFVTTQQAGGTRHAEIGKLLAEKDHHLTVITGSVSYLTGTEKETGGTSTNPNGMRVIAVNAGKGTHRNAITRVLGFFQFMIGSYLKGVNLPDVDIVWGTSPNLFQAYSAYRVAKAKHVPFVLEIRDLWPDFAIGMGVLKNSVLIWSSRLLEKFLYRKADRIVVNSPGFIKHIQKVSGKTAMLIPNGADTAMFDLPDQAGAMIRKEIGLKADEFIVMYTGAHGPANDLTTVLKAAGQLKSHPEVKFVLIGSGKEKKQLVRYAESNSLSNVLFLDPVAKSKIGNYMQAADAGLAILKNIPMFTTTYPNKVFDFMAAGKPVLCQINGVIRKVVEEHQCGLFVNPGSPEALASAVLELAADPERGKLMGINGKRAIQEVFSREKAAEQYEALFLELLHSQ